MKTIFEPDAAERLSPEAVVAGCIESGSDLLLLDSDRLAPEFFDLGSGIAGELLHRLSLYQLRMAAVVPNVESHGERFEEFVREANQGHLCRFFPTRQRALEWLQG